MSSSEENSSDDDQTGFSSNTAPPSDLKDNQKRWLVIGICLHDILSPVLRKYIESEINQLYTSLVTSNNINAQLYNNGFLERYPPSSNGYRLNYETINNNKAFYKGQVKLYDYKVQNAVDFSKLFLQQLNIAHYTAFDEACDSSALLAILINVDTFPTVVQHDANSIRSNIRNPWAHCNFSQWDTGRNVYSIQLMINLVKKLSLILSEENRIIGDLNRWVTTGLNFLSGTTIGLELVTEVSHRTRILSKQIRNSTKHASETDNNLTEVRNVIKALKDTVDRMDGKMSKLEEEVQKVSNKDEMHSFSMGKTFKALKSADENLYERMTKIDDEQRRLIENNKCQDEETIPKNIQEENEKAFKSTGKNTHERMAKIEDEHKRIKIDIERQEDETIPKNIRAQHDEDIQEWKRDEQMFVVTRATKYVNESLESTNCVIVTGKAGTGKSSIIHFVALQLKENNGFEIIPFVTDPKEIIYYFNPKRNQVFVIDDICGKNSININTVQLWKDLNDRIEKLFKTDEENNAVNLSRSRGVKRKILLISCRNHIYRNVHFQAVNLFTKFECNLLSYELCLLPTEKELMVERYISADMIYSLPHLAEYSDLFPLLCQISKGKDRKELEKFFSSPIDYIKGDIDNLLSSDNNMQACAVVLCILFGDSFDTEWFEKNTVSARVAQKIRVIVTEFNMNLNKKTERYLLIQAFGSLEGIYLKRRGTKYGTIHDKIFEISAVICGNRFIYIFIKYISSSFIRDHFRFESVPTENDNNYIIVPEDHEYFFFQRLIFDLKNQDIKSTIHNKQLEFGLFRKKLIAHLKLNMQEETRSCLCVLLHCFEPSSKDIRYYLMNIEKFGIRYKKEFLETTPLVEAASAGFIDIIEFMIEIKCNVNKVDMLGRSPLYKACEKGNINVVKLLIRNKAYIHQLTIYGESSIFVACKEGHVDVVKLLLVNKADIFHRTISGWNPLHAAVSQGRTAVVEMILTKCPLCIVDCARSGPSLVYLAYKGGYYDIAKLLQIYDPELNVFQRLYFGLGT